MQNVNAWICLWWDIWYCTNYPAFFEGPYCICFQFSWWSQTQTWVMDQIFLVNIYLILRGSIFFVQVEKSTRCPYLNMSRYGIFSSQVNNVQGTGNIFQFLAMEKNISMSCDIHYMMFAPVPMCINHGLSLQPTVKIYSFNPCLSGVPHFRQIPCAQKWCSSRIWHCYLDGMSDVCDGWGSGTG